MLKSLGVGDYIEFYHYSLILTGRLVCRRGKDSWTVEMLEDTKINRGTTLEKGEMLVVGDEDVYRPITQAEAQS